MQHYYWRKPIGQKNWSQSELVEIIKEFMRKNNRQPKIADLKDLHKFNPKMCPSEGPFNDKGGLTYLIELAGQKPERSHNAYLNSDEVHLLARSFLLNFFKKNGRLPSDKEILLSAKSLECPHSNTLKKYCGIRYGDLAITLGLRKVRTGKLANLVPTLHNGFVSGLKYNK